MSQEVANAQAIGNAVKGLTKAAPLSKVIKNVKKASAKGAAKGRLESRKNQKSKTESTNDSKDESTNESPIWVSSTRVYPNSPKEIGGPSAPTPTVGKLAITAPGPTAKESATAKAAAAKKGSKNASTIKIAEPIVDLSSPNGGIIHRITDVPRQFKKNG